MREALDQAGRHLCHRLGRLHVREQQQELVAADARHDVLAARHRLQALSDLLQHQVADRMAVGVVDRLEAVEVDEQQGQSAGAGIGLGGGGGQAVFEIDTGRQLGQAVDGRRGSGQTPRRLGLARRGIAERLQQHEAEAGQHGQQQRLGPGRDEDGVQIGRGGGRDREQHGADQRAGATRRFRLAARLEFQADGDEGGGQHQDGHARPPRAGGAGGAEQARRREHRMPVGNDERQHPHAGERRQRLACRGGGAGASQAGKREGQQAGHERNAGERTGAGFERLEETTWPPQSAAAEDDGRHAQHPGDPAAAPARRREDLGPEPQKRHADQKPCKTGQQPLAIQEVHEGRARGDAGQHRMKGSSQEHRTHLISVRRAIP